MVACNKEVIDRLVAVHLIFVHFTLSVGLRQMRERKKQLENKQAKYGYLGGR
jgi:hypothetical protein